MARLAAGLLLADRRDAAGRELFERARAALVRGEQGGRVLSGAAGAVDGWIGTAALLVAARQLGEDRLATELARGLAPRLYLGMGEDVEAAFWLLAASVYGGFGLDPPAEVEVVIDGAARRVRLAGGAAAVALPAGRTRVVVKSGAPVLARLEARYLRPIGPATDAPLALRLEGVTGFAGQTAGLELVVESTAGADAVLERPVVELLAPSLASLGEESLAGLAAVPGVAAVEPADPQGMVRLSLAPLGPREVRRIPLPVRWLGAGEVGGFAAAAFDAQRPWRITTLPAGRVSVVRPPEEVWQ
jgi:hypothetical protein